MRLVAMLLCVFMVEVAHTEETEVSFEWRNASSTTGASIEMATAHIWRGIAPSAAEQRSAGQAMEQLVRQKEQSAAYIIDALQDNSPLTPYHYAMVLWSLGPDQLRKLEPTVLSSKDQQVRLAGAVILGRGKSPIAIELLLAMLKREENSEVIAEVLSSLANNGAVDDYRMVLPFLDSEETEVRLAAIQFFWHLKAEGAKNPLLALLEKENDVTAGYWLVTVLNGYNVSQELLLKHLKHQNSGIRVGIYKCLAGRNSMTDEDYRIVLDNAPLENDPQCMLALASCLHSRKDPSCIGILIRILENESDPETLPPGSSVKTAAHSTLLNLTRLPFRVTDEDRKNAGQQGIYAGAAKKYAEWWSTHREIIRWDSKQYQYVVEMKEDDQQESPPDNK